MIKKRTSLKVSNGIHFHIITLFRDAFTSYLKTSIIGRAIADGRIAVSFYNPRDFTKDKGLRVDRRPYGGGPGMVIEALPVLKAVEKARGRKKNVKIVFFSPSGKQFTNVHAKLLAQRHKHIILIAGHYEGIDARVKKALPKTEEISIGPYIVTGGELPALVVIDATVRQIKGVLGNYDSLEERRAHASIVYTRPEILHYRSKKYPVPKILHTLRNGKEIRAVQSRLVLFSTRFQHVAHRGHASALDRLFTFAILSYFRTD
jgi:tRNA (guanine37-N1)-methyltransferase